MAENDDEGVSRLAALCSSMGRLWPEQRIDVWTDAPLAATVEDCKLSLIGKVLSNPPINLPAFQSTLRRVWRIDQVDISVREEGLYVAKFKSVADRQHVLDGGPWQFSGHLVIFKAWIPDTPLHCYDFSTYKFWVQVFGIPLEWSSATLDEVIPETPPPSHPLVVAQPPCEHNNRDFSHASTLPLLHQDTIFATYYVQTEKQPVDVSNQKSKSPIRVEADITSAKLKVPQDLHPCAI